MTPALIPNEPYKGLGNEAELTSDGNCAALEAQAQKLAWHRLGPVSGLECVQALVREGFVVQFANTGYADLKRYNTMVQVPLVEILEPVVLITLLAHAKIAPARFLALLEEA
jgi:hypothetical protein